MNQNLTPIPGRQPLRWLRQTGILLGLLVLASGSHQSFAQGATLARGATMEALGTGNGALLLSPLTDPENDGDEAAGPTSPTWNWRSISSSAEPGFQGGEFSFNVFDHLVDGGGNAKWCCGEPVTAATLSAANPLNITVELHDRYRLTHFTITSGNDTPARDPRDFQILGSNDGFTFEPIFTQIGVGTNATTTTNATTSLWGPTRLLVLRFNLDAPARPYRFLRFQCTATYSTPPFTTAAAFFQVSEIEYYGLQGGALTVEALGIGDGALLKGDVTDPDNNGNKAAGPADTSWNWTSVTANNKPAFGNDGAFNVFDNLVVGSTNTWCCDDATAANPLHVTVELPRGIALTHFTIASSAEVSGAPTKFQILGSNDGNSFTPIYTRDDATSLWTAANQVVRIDPAEPSPLYKYLRYQAIETPGPTHQIAEIEYFGKFGGLNNPVPSDISAGATFATVFITDGSDTILDPGSVQLTINGAAAAVTLQKTGNITTVTHARSPVFASGSSHTWTLSFRDNAGNFLARSGAFTVAAYTTINAAYAIASVDTTKPGFKTRTHQMDIYRNPATGIPANAERQLADGYIDPNSNLPFINGADISLAQDGFIIVPSVVNWNSSVGGASGAFPNDEEVPGIPGFGIAPTDRYVVSIETFLELKAGVSYRLAVNSDDGFRLSFGWGSGDVAGTQLGTAGDRGFTQSTMDIIAPVDGFYPVRLMYWETGGGDGCEFYTVNIATGERILINDLNNPAAVRAFRESPVSRPYVARTLPSVNYGYAFADEDVVIDIADGALPLSGTPVLRINNVEQAITTSKSGNTTRVRRAGSLSNLLFSGANNVSLVYSYSAGGSASNITNTWSFNVPAYTWPIPAANRVPANQVGGAGFVVRAFQLDRSKDANQGNGGRHTGNNMPGPEIQITGGYIDPNNNQPYPNLAVAGTGPGGTHEIPDVLNWNSGAGGNPANAGIFNADIAVPGLPGTGTSGSTAIGLDNSVHEITTYLDLPAGAHIFGLNVDDGWICISAPNNRDTLGTLLGFRNGPGGQNGNPVNNPNAAFTVLVPEAGIYPLRILFWQGGGGVNLEFLAVDRQTGTQILINDTGGSMPSVVANPGQTASPYIAYSTYTGPVRPWVKFSVYPMPNIGVANPRLNGGNAVTLWQNRDQQSGPGPITRKLGFLNNSWNSGEVQNSSTAQRPFGDSVGAVVADLGSGTVGMILDGVSVQPSVTSIPNTTDRLVLFTPSQPLSSVSNHIAGLVYAGTTNYWIFNVITNVTVPAGVARPLVEADPNRRGFRARVAQSRTARPGSGNTQTNAEAQLAGAIANIAVPGPEPDGSYIVPGIINWNVSKVPGNTPFEVGNFQPLMGGPADEAFPGLPGAGLTGTARFENFSVEITALLDLPAGYQKFGVNGDDGWKVQIGGPGQISGTVLFGVDRGAGAQDIPFAFITPEAGLYPIRLVFYQGGGGGNLEFFTYGANNEKIPVNANRPDAVKAYLSQPLITAPQLTVARNTDASITITASSGTIQHTDSLTPVNWVDAGPGPINVPASQQTGTRFYRARQ